MNTKNTEKKGYFYDNEENAVLAYINANTREEKNELYDKYLKNALTIMIESIIRRYNLYPPDESFDETFDDTMSFIIMKMDKFDPNNGRAFSYLQTICRNYLIHKINKFKTKQIRNTSYDDLITVVNEEDPYEQFNLIEDNIYESSNFHGDLISETINNINMMIIENDTKKPKDKSKLNEDEIRIGQCLIDLFTNWEYIFETVGCDKFNKNSILTYIKTTTNMNTKEIRDCMRKFKIMYFSTKNELLD